MNAKRALITGITGQDGSYLAELLLAKGYEVHGIIRRASTFNTERIDPISQDRHESGARMFLHYGDLTDANGLSRLIRTIKPTEVYNLAAQSHVRVSFDQPIYTADTTAVGSLKLLEAVRDFQESTGYEIRYYQASSSEMFGKVVETPQKETTPFYPRSPYAAAKAYAFYITRNYRESYGMFAVNGILFNHESPRRGETFVTRKISRAAARIKAGMQDCLYLGNLDAKRDWGFAGDYVEAMWLMLQADKPDDYVVATGETYSVRDFCDYCFDDLDLPLTWQGEGVDEVGVDATGRVVVRIDPRYFRPAEVETLLGNPAKAKEKLGWVPEITTQQMCAEMVAEDLKSAKRHALLKEHGYDIPVALENG